MTGHCTDRGGRGCLCAWHQRRRTYGRRYAATKRRHALEATWRTDSRCRKRFCGGPIETVIGPLGQTVLQCTWCARQEAGICRDCNRPVEGTRRKSLRCAAHKHAAIRASLRRYAERNHELVLARARKSYSEPERRRRRNEYKRWYRKTHPEKVRAQKKRYVEKHRLNPNSWYNRYHRRYRAKYREQKREMERERLKVLGHQRAKPIPRCKRCGGATRWRPLFKGHAGKPWTICTKCLYPCERKERMRKRRIALKRSKEWLASIPAPGRIRRPPQATVRGPGWERTCITPGCDRVVTHRKKKCTVCRQREAEAAVALITAHVGRGRRVDLQARRAS